MNLRSYVTSLAVLMILFMSDPQIYGQKYDYIWVLNGGQVLDFRYTDSLYIPPDTCLFCVGAEKTTISDANGNLRYIVGSYTDNGYVYQSLCDSACRDTLNRGGGGVCPNLLLPGKLDTNACYLFYTDYNGLPYQGWDSRLRYAPLPRHDLGAPCGRIGELVPGIGRVSLKMTAVNQSDGDDWWIVQHSVMGDTFYVLDFYNDSIRGVLKQNEGCVYDTGTVYVLNSFGEMSFNPQGTKLVDAMMRNNVVLYDFDRCTGILTCTDTLFDPLPHPRWAIYHDAAFSSSGRYLYVVTKGDYAGLSEEKIYQFDTWASDIAASRQLVFAYDTSASTYVQLGGLELAPDGRIYLHSLYGDGATFFQARVGVIEFPDTVVAYCGLNMGKFVYADEHTSGGCFIDALISFPTYRAGPVLPQPAGAGSDRVICPGDTVQLGVADTSGVSGLQYVWSPAYGLSSDTVAQPYAFPDTTTTYVVTKTRQGYSCAWSQDTVVVIVRDTCTIVPPLPPELWLGNLYPNPSTGWLYMDYILPPDYTLSIGITDVLGRRLETRTLPTGTHRMEWDLNGLPAAPYVVELWLNNARIRTLKWVRVE